MVSIFHNLINGRICNQIPQNTLTQSFNTIVSITSLQIFIASKWSIIISKHSPKRKPLNDNALHLDGNIIGRKVDPLNPTGKSNSSIKGPLEHLQPNPSLNHLAIPNQQQPLIRLGFNPSPIQVNQQAYDSNGEEN